MEWIEEVIFAIARMGRACSLTEWAHFIKTRHKASMSYWWVYCRHCVIAAMNALGPETHLNNTISIQDFINKLPLPASTGIETTLEALVGRRSVMKAHLAQCVNASPIPPNPIVKRRAGKRGVHCAIAEWAHFHRLDKEGYIGNTNYFPVVCKYCSEAFENKIKLSPPEVFPGRKESMRRHLTQCEYFTGKLPDKKKTNGAKSLSEWEFFIRHDRQPGSMYHFAKCRLCTEAYERNPDKVPPPKVILGRKHNMQTHLANCEHMLNQGDVMEDIEFSSEDDIDMPSSPQSIPNQVANDSIVMEEALILYTMEYGLPFSWVESRHMQMIFPNPLPEASVLGGPILKNVLRSIEKRYSESMARGDEALTLVIEVITPLTNDTLTCVAWLVQGNGVIRPQRIAGQTELCWECTRDEFEMSVELRTSNAGSKLVGVLLPLTVPRLNEKFPKLFNHCNGDIVFHSILQCVLQDDMVVRLLRTAMKLTPISSSNWTDWKSWIDLVSQYRSHDPLEIDFWHQFDRVGSILSTLGCAIHQTRQNTLSLAHMLHYLSELYLKCQALHRTTLLQLKLEHELDCQWQMLEQPLFILAYVLHPALERQITKIPDEIGDLACRYYSTWFSEEPIDLRDDLMKYANGELLFPKCQGDFESIREHIVSVSESHHELARMMQYLEDIVPSFHLDSYDLPKDHYSYEQWETMKYIAHCQAPMQFSTSHSSPLTDVDALLLKWRANQPTIPIVMDSPGSAGWKINLNQLLQK